MKDSDMTPDVPEYLRAQVKHLRLNPVAVCQTTLRWRAVEGLDLLALLASDGRWGRRQAVDELQRHVASGGTGDLGTVDIVALAAFARASTGWANSIDSVREVADLFQAVRMLRQHRELPRDTNIRVGFDRLEAQSNLALRRFDHVAGIQPDLVDDGDLPWSVASEMAHPDHGQPGSTWDQWLETFNGVFTKAGLAPVGLAPGDGTPFDRLTVARPLEPVDGPLVTVVTSVFKPDQSLFTSLRSILDQSWRNIELLVVDDDSPASYQPLIEEAVAIDDRISLFRMPVNGGTYRIRNFALSRAKGEFITFQDADDWSHPQRIERQVGMLLGKPELVVSFSKSVRLFDDLSLNKLGYRPMRRNVSSMLFRREAVTNAIGMFDTVRKSADSEYADRIRTVFGPEASAFVDAPLALVQLTAGSLSREDFQFGWRQPERVLYRQAFEHWHSLIAAGVESPMMETEARRFPAPPIHLGLGKEPLAFDVTIVANWRAGIERYRGLVDQVRVLAQSGLSLAALPAEAMRHSKARRQWSDPAVTQLAFEGSLTQISWEGPASTRLLIIQDPELMSSPRPAEPVAVRPDRVVINADVPPRAPGGGWLVYDPAVIEANALETFGVRPTWLPASPEIADALRADGAAEEIHSAEPLGYVSAAVSQRAAWSARPVVGMTDLDPLSRDRLTPDQLFDLLPRNDRIDVRVRDAAGALDTKSAPRPLPPTWQRQDSMPIEDFVDSLDVLVLPPRRSLGPERPWAAVRAMAGGTVVIAPRQYEMQLGTAAIYLDDRTVEDVVLDLVDRPDEVEAQRQTARAWHADSFSADALVRVVKDLLD